jgi:hypothetical protein
MIAMQYSFTLPADYDMSIIDRRIRDKGPLLDNFPNLRLKAYLTARTGDEETASRENLSPPSMSGTKRRGSTTSFVAPALPQSLLPSAVLRSRHGLSGKRQSLLTSAQPGSQRET